jgi:hypothetical protein
MTCPRTNIFADKIVCVTLSDPFFFQVEHVEPVIHYSVTGNELLKIIFHVLPDLEGTSLKNPHTMNSNCFGVRPGAAAS